MTYAKNEKRPSKMFTESIRSGGGSHNMTCGCGRVHYCPDSDNFYHNEDDEDEEDAYRYYLQDALEEQKKDSDGVVIHYDVDCVVAKDLAGITFVLECPCNGLRKYEDFIWQNRNSIRDYLKIRIEQEQRWAEQELTLNKLAGI